jgi:hypothetical protein
VSATVKAPAYPCMVTIKHWRRHADEGGNVQNTYYYTIDQELCEGEADLRTMVKRARATAEVATSCALFVNGRVLCHYGARPSTQQVIVEEYEA